MNPIVMPTASASTIGAVEGRDGSSADGDTAGGGCVAATGMTIVGSWLLGSIRAVSVAGQSRDMTVDAAMRERRRRIFDGAGSRSANAASSAAT
jgi:hypothetical protein